MARQEEIEQGFYDRLCAILNHHDRGGVINRDTARAVLSWLNSKGVVIKVDRKLPSVFDCNEDVISALEYKKKLVGYEAIEPIIKENK